MKPETKATLRALRETGEFWTEIALLQFTSDLARLMEEDGISRAQLARTLGCSAAYVTQVLSGNVNCTVSTLVRFALALKAAVNIRVRRISELNSPEVMGDSTVTVFVDYKETKRLKASMETTASSGAGAIATLTETRTEVGRLTAIMKVGQ